MKCGYACTCELQFECWFERGRKYGLRLCCKHGVSSCSCLAVATDTSIATVLSIRPNERTARNEVCESEVVL